MLAIFFSSYLMFLLASAPLNLLTNNIKLPKNISIQGVTGSIWQGEIASVIINQNKIDKISTDLSFWSLFTLSPKVDVNFGDAMLAGPEGKFTLQVSSEDLALSDLALFISANDVANQLPLPIPVSAQGNIEVNIPSLHLSTADKLSCTQAQGDVIWLRAGVVALEQNITLGRFRADISCKDGDLLAVIPPKNNLGLSFDAVFALPEQRPSGQGYLKPGVKFPNELKSALSFLGRPDNQGRYRLRF